MPYSTENNVRLRGGFYVEEAFSASEGKLTTLVVEDRAYSVIILTKTSGTTITTLVSGTDYDFLPPNTIALKGSGLGVAGESFDILYGADLNTHVMGIVLGQATAIVQAALLSQYESSMTNWETLDAIPTATEPGGNPLAPAIIQAITSALARCMAVLDFSTKNETRDPDLITAMRQEKKAILDMLDDIQSGDLKIDGLDIPILVGDRVQSSSVFADLPYIPGIDFVAENERISRRGRPVNISPGGVGFL